MKPALLSPLLLASLAYGELPPELEGFDAPAQELPGELEGFGEEDPLAGFDEPAAMDHRFPEEDRSPLHTTGSFKLSSAYAYGHKAPASGATDNGGLSRLRGEGELELTYRMPHDWKARVEARAFYDALFALRDDGDFTDAHKRSLETEAEIKEAWVAGTLAKGLDLKAGRQIMVWGKSDNIRVADVLNPLDNREPGMTDIEDLRLPVAMTRLDYSRGDWVFTAVLVHEHRFGKLPPGGSDFFPFPFAMPPEETPESSFDTTRPALAAKGYFTGWDASFYLAQYDSDEWYLENGVRTHPLVTMAGAAVNAVSGSWLFKGEAAHLWNLKFTGLPEQKNRLDLLAGAEYTGFTDATLSLEIADRHLFDFDQRLENAPDYEEEELFQYAFRANKTYLHDTLSLTWLASLFAADGSGGGFQRFWAEYDVTDAFQVTGGLVDYVAGDMVPLGLYNENDRLFAEALYRF